MALVTENHKARLHGGLVHSVITQTSATAASTLPLNSLSDLHLNKKNRRVRSKASRKKIIRNQHTRLLIKVQKHPHWMTNNDGLPTFLTPHPCLNQQAPREKLPSLSRPTCTAHIVEEFFSARVPRSSAEVRGLLSRTSRKKKVKAEGNAGR